MFEATGVLDTGVVSASGMVGAKTYSRPFVRNPKINYPTLRKKKKPEASPKKEEPDSPSPSATDVAERDRLVALAQAVSARRRDWEGHQAQRVLAVQECLQDREALWGAAKSGDVKQLQRLLDKGVDIEAADSEGHSALMHAAIVGENDVLESLLEAQACVDRRDDRNRSALYWAAKGGHDVACLTMLEAGATCDKAEVEHTCEVAAADCKALIETWAVEYATQPQGRPGAARRGSWVGATAKVALPGHCILLDAVRQGCCEEVKLLLESGQATLSAPMPCGPRDGEGYTPLMMAAQQGNIELCKVLLDAGGAATIDDVGPAGRTALLAAVSAKAVDVLPLLLDAGATPFCVTVEERAETVIEVARKLGLGGVEAMLVQAGMRWCGVESEVEHVRHSGCYEEAELDSMLAQLFC